MLWLQMKRQCLLSYISCTCNDPALSTAHYDAHTPPYPPRPSPHPPPVAIMSDGTSPTPAEDVDTVRAAFEATNIALPVRAARANLKHRLGPTARKVWVACLDTQTPPPTPSSQLPANRASRPPPPPSLPPPPPPPVVKRDNGGGGATAPRLTNPRVHLLHTAN